MKMKEKRRANNDNKDRRKVTRKTKELGTTFDLIPQRGYVGASRLSHSVTKTKIPKQEKLGQKLCL